MWENAIEKLHIESKMHVIHGDFRQKFFQSLILIIKIVIIITVSSIIWEKMI